MIIHECKAVHIHIPKTAGVSLIHSMISQVLGYDSSGTIKELPKEIKDRFELHGQQKHKQAQFYVPADLTEEQWNDYYKFAIVRNPWDRVVSEFHWRHSLPHRKPSSDFKEFILYCKKRMDDKTNKANDIYWTHAQIQKSYIVNNNNNIILDDVFRFENLSETVNNIGIRLGVSLSLQKHNTSNHRNYRDYYDDQTIKLVRELYQEDIDMFNYEF